MATKKETTAEQTAESTMPTQEEMQKLLEENARLKAERDAAEAARIDAELAAAQSKETEQPKEDEELTAGQKQAAKAEKETIRLPITGNGDDDVFVSVNGYKYLIQRGKEVEVPRFVAEVLKNSENQKAATYRMMEEMQKKAEDGTGQFL